jgi:hypothetical protein
MFKFILDINKFIPFIMADKIPQYPTLYGPYLFCDADKINSSNNIKNIIIRIINIKDIILINQPIILKTRI